MIGQDAALHGTEYRDGYFDGQRRDRGSIIATIRAKRRASPILCLPGLTRNARDFAQFAERISPRFRVIALDFRGRAGSEIMTRCRHATFR